MKGEGGSLILTLIRGRFLNHNRRSRFPNSICDKGGMSLESLLLWDLDFELSLL